MSAYSGFAKGFGESKGGAKLGGKLADKLKGLSSGSKSGSLKADSSMDDMSEAAEPASYKRGGKVKKTGFAKVHRGEKVLTKKQQKKIGKK